MNFTIADSFIFSLLLIFCRIGTLCMFLPLTGEAAVPQTIRLTFALFFSAIVMSSMIDAIPAKPANVADMVLLVAQEITIGVTIGIAIKAISSAIHVMGLTISYQSGLATAMIFDPSQGTQGSIFGNFLSITFLMLILATDLHLVLIKAAHHSYSIFGFGFFSQNYDSFVNLIIRVCSDAFNIGVRMAAPFLVIGILLNLAAGILSRLMPQMQVFFILMPVQILIHIAILALTFGGVMMWFLNYYQEYITKIFG